MAQQYSWATVGKFERLVFAGIVYSRAKTTNSKYLLIE